MEPARTFKYKKVLVIDDADVDRLLAEKIIKKYDFAEEVVLMDSAEEMLNYLNEHKDEDESRQLIFLDINMPGMDGWEFLERFNSLDKKIQEHFKILVISTSINPIDRTRALSNKHVVDYIIKPISKEVILNLHAELEQKIYERTRQLTEALKKEKELGELKSRFVSFASHEFRTPLSIILSSANLLSRYVKTEDQPKRDEHIERIRSSVAALTDILNDFLSISKFEDGNIDVQYLDFDIKKFTSTAIDDLNNTVSNNQYIQYIHTGPVSVALAPSLYRNILINLLSNAIKFSPKDTKIEVETICTNDSYILSVADKGIGIPAEDQKHLFERFFRGKNAVNIQGTGLGLHIVARYAELMNGTIRYESALEKGTRFIISFPNTQQ